MSLAFDMIMVLFYVTRMSALFNVALEAFQLNHSMLGQSRKVLNFLMAALHQHRT